MVDITHTPDAYRPRTNQATARALSIFAALAVDAGLVWLLYVRAKFNPPFGDAEMFWVRIVAGFGAYAVLQQWTLANQTGRGDDIVASMDKAVALSPLLLAAALEAYWVGMGTWVELSWRHHAAALLWSAFALTDYFATDTTNQRLSAQRFHGGDAGES
ncbi:MAG TPA: hypothetical protein VFR00_12880 [Hyphomicrobiaceae bacterium]|nr:hypothetical protein [Hyphomicrobiaceae bacterium]